ncbi:MAG: cob(I)yrinic acid a,c-diamide adenosyltransferase [Lachnospiraceae bacterium]|nr:cob(I)yrinic acid a,c-diamide adenosyltransferase [Lachnospiraceae bacterium]
MNKGKIHIFCGKGTGKTSAALGKGIREAGAGRSVIVIQFLKGKNNERAAEYFRRLEPELRLFRFEKSPENYESLTEREREDECRNIKNGLNFARKVLVTEECDILILDEILGLTDRGIVTLEELRGLMDAVPESMELYLTGMSRCEELWPAADEVTVMTSPCSVPVS